MSKLIIRLGQELIEVNSSNELFLCKHLGDGSIMICDFALLIDLSNQDACKSRPSDLYTFGGPFDYMYHPDYEVGVRVGDIEILMKLCKE